MSKNVDAFRNALDKYVFFFLGGGINLQCGHPTFPVVSKVGEVLQCQRRQKTSGNTLPLFHGMIVTLRPLKSVFLTREKSFLKKSYLELQTH